MTLKANQGKKHSGVETICETTCFGRTAAHRPVHDELDDGHGRLVRRRVFVCPDATALEPLRYGPGLKSVPAVETIRSSTGPAKPNLKSATSCPAVPTSRKSRRKRSADIGRPTIACPGCSTSPSTKITAGSGIGTLSRTSLCSKKSPSISFAATKHQSPDQKDGEKWPRGITDTWSTFSPATFTRNPCAGLPRATRAETKSYGRGHWNHVHQELKDLRRRESRRRAPRMPLSALIVFISFFMVKRML